MHEVPWFNYETMKMVRANRRRVAIVKFRQTHCAHRDAAACYVMARDDRPLELGKRLRNGRRAGGLEEARRGFDEAPIAKRFRTSSL